jgi:hypothetical protein
LHDDQRLAVEFESLEDSAFNSRAVRLASLSRFRRDL